MREHSNEKISLFVDDQLERQQTLRLLKEIKLDPVLQDKFRRYQLISQAIKSDQCLVAGSDFVGNIHQRLRQESAYLMPRKKVHVDWQKAGLAVAASVVLAVVWMFGNIEKHTNPYAGPNTVAQRVVQQEQVNPRFKEYLQAHDNVWYVNENVGGQQYARLAGYRK